MALSRPDALWLLFLLLPFAALEARRVHRLLAGERALWGEAAARAWLRRTILSRALVALALVFGVLALAAPLGAPERPRGSSARADTALVLDLSRSMLVQDQANGERRLDAALRACRDLSGLGGERRFALVLFKGSAHLAVPLTDDRELLALFLESADPAYSTAAGSDQEEALRTAAAALRSKTDAERAIVLLSDGEALSGDARKAAAEARAEGIAVHAIGFGSESGGPVPDRDGGGKPVISRRDAASLRGVASAGGGLYAPSEDKAAVARLRARMGLRPEASASGPARGLDSLAACLAVAFLFLSFIAERLPRSGRIAALFIVFLASASCSPLARGLALAQAADRAARGDHEGALRIYDRLMSSAGAAEAGILAFDRGLSLAALGRRDEAFSALEEAAASEDRRLSASAWYAIGWTRYSWGEYREAWTAFRKSLEAAPGAADARVALELARERMREGEESAAAAAADASVEGGSGGGQEEFDLIRNAEGRRFRAGRSEEGRTDVRDW